MKFTRYNNPSKRRRTPRREHLPCLACYDVFGTPEWFEGFKREAVKTSTYEGKEKEQEQGGKV